MIRSIKGSLKRPPLGMRSMILHSYPNRRCQPCHKMITVAGASYLAGIRNVNKDVDTLRVGSAQISNSCLEMVASIHLTLRHLEERVDTRAMF